MNINYKINQSADNFKFGNTFTPTTYIYRAFHLGMLSLNPNTGLLYEIIGSNKFNNEKVADTGGYSFFSSAGMELKLNRLGIGGNFLFPMLSALSNGQTAAKGRGIFHVSYMF